MAFYSFLIICICTAEYDLAKSTPTGAVLVHTNLKSVLPATNERSKQEEVISDKANNSTENDTTTKIGDNSISLQ